MNVEILLKFIEVWLSLFLLYIVYFYVYRKFVIRAYQQYLFSIRDDMFIHFHKLGNDGDRQIYDIMREWLNLSISIAPIHNSVDAFLSKFIFKDKNNNMNISKDEFIDSVNSNNSVFSQFKSPDNYYGLVFGKLALATGIFYFFRRPFTFIFIFSKELYFVLKNPNRHKSAVPLVQANHSRKSKKKRQDFLSNIIKSDAAEKYMKDFLSTPQGALKY